MKRTDSVVAQYCSRLSIDNLRWLWTRLDERINSDLAEALDFLSANSEMDKILSAAKTCDELYDVVDVIQRYVTVTLQSKVPDMEFA